MECPGTLSTYGWDASRRVATNDALAKMGASDGSKKWIHFRVRCSSVAARSSSPVIAIVDRMQYRRSPLDPVVER
jgi:hypothetical protein